MFLEEMIPVPLEKLPCWNNPVKAEELAKVMVLANAPNLFIPKRLAPTFR